MTAEKQRIAIAEACGWSDCHFGAGWEFDVTGTPPDWSGTRYQQVPDYLNDLNAMHKAEKVLTYSQVSDYVTHMRRFTPDENWTGCWGLHATAAQRAEAFLRTLNKWEDT